MTVLVAGPPAAGVTSLVTSLRRLLPDVDVVESRTGEVAVAVLVASAVAPPAPSDYAVLDAAAARAHSVLGTVTKIDAHRCWRDVLAQASARYPGSRWIGTAAAPRLGSPNVDALAAAVRARLAERPAARGARSASAERMVALRTGLHRERLDLGRANRDRCARLRAEFRGVAAEMPRRSRAAVEDRLRAAADALLCSVDERIDRSLADLAGVLGAEVPRSARLPSPVWDGPPTVSRRAERSLTLMLGAGFGVGIALAAGRLFAALAPWAAVAAQSAGALVGVLLTGWLVSTRELLHDRAVVDRWVCDIAAGLRAHADDRVASRLLDAEVDFVKQIPRTRRF